MDLNDLSVFEEVGAQLSFSAAARSLGVPKSSVSRSVARLEGALGVRLLQRTTREVVLTETGAALLARCRDILGRVEEAVDYIGGVTAAPRGVLRLSAGIGFGVNVLSELLPRFLALHPEVRVSLDLSSRLSELVAERVDVAIRMGPMPDSSSVAVRLGSLSRHLCVAPAYLERLGASPTLETLAELDSIEMPGLDGRPRRWTFRKGDASVAVEVRPRLEVNDALTIHRMIVNGAGVGLCSGYVCAADVAAGRLVRLFPDWRLDPVDVSLVFPSRRDLSPAVRAFIDFMKIQSGAAAFWREDPRCEDSGNFQCGGMTDGAGARTSGEIERT
jgi:LysR family transcriptional regulator for bpeEF and oprC